jgi:hypothetical protein
MAMNEGRRKKEEGRRKKEVFRWDWGPFRVLHENNIFFI